MSYSSWRGVVGVVAPSYRTGTHEEFIRLLPEGIGVIIVHLDDAIKEGTEKELVDAMEPIRQKVAKLASLKVSIIHPEGVPPFVQMGFKAEAEMVRSLEDKHGIPILTSGVAQTEALRAMDVKRLLGITYFGEATDRKCDAYLRDAGFEVLGIQGITSWAMAANLTPLEIYAFAKAQFLKHNHVDGLWIPGGGGGWPALTAAPLLEQDLQVPVVTNNNAKLWAIQKRLHIRQPVRGKGRLLEELP